MAPTVIHGFELIREQHIPEINSHVRLFRHQRTGAELLSLENDDENKSFAVGFQTPPPDDTGLPHIMEHSVLCGSRRYPTKEPFVELLKSSMKTFLNAFTTPDMTMYPVASTNTKDFYNLVDVYMDAVFFPLITEQTLMQEGWHYEAESPDGPLIYKGVVFNEMKSVYSVPDEVLEEALRAELLPDTPYARAYGGHPASIPDLSYTQFRDFHATYYHPSNARIFFYGDDDPDARLKFVDAFLAEFERREIDSSLPSQPRFDAPRSLRIGYDAGGEGEDDGQPKTAQSATAWLLGDVTERETVLALNILEHILIGNSAAPLRKTLIDSRLGEDLAGGGLSDWQKELNFSVGLKGIKPEDADKVEPLLLETLTKLADEGIDPDTVAASMNTIEFRLREMNTGGFPRGLFQMISAMPTWMHGGDPLDALAFARHLDAIKTALDADPRFFEGLIRTHLLDNPHRVTVIIDPDSSVGPAREKAERDRLDAHRARLNEGDVKQLIETATALKAHQESPDDPADIAKIPRLTLDDLEREVKLVDTRQADFDGATVLHHNLPTSQIVYLNLGLDMTRLPDRLLPLVPLFARSLTQMGTQTQDFVQLSQRIGSETGGVSASPFVSMARDAERLVAQLFVGGKATVEKLPALLNILNDILTTVKLDNPERFMQMALESKARMESYLNIGGQMFINSRMQAHFNPAGWANEQMGGISYLFFLRELVKRAESDWASVLADLEALRGLLVNRAAMLVTVVVDEDSYRNAVEQPLKNFMAALPAADTPVQPWTPTPLPDHEVFTTPAQVNFVGKAANLYQQGYEPSGSQVVVFKHMNLDYMWNRVRVQGGAYGGRASFSPYTGVVSFLSWRDPNLRGTLEVYDQAADYLSQVEMSETDLERAIIGAISDLDSYQLPDAKGFSATVRYLLGYSDAERQKTRDEVFSTTVQDFRRMGMILATLKDVGKVAVVGSPQAAEKANADGQAPKLTVTPVL